MALPPYDAQAVERAYLASLTPPPDILQRTFGIIYERRTLLDSDSVTYVYENMHATLLGVPICKGYRVTEHPLPPPLAGPPPNWRIAGAAAAAPQFIGARRPLTPTIQPALWVRCNDPHLRPVVPGSLSEPH